MLNKTQSRRIMWEKSIKIHCKLGVYVCAFGIPWFRFHFGQCIIHHIYWWISAADALQHKSDGKSCANWSEWTEIVKFYPFSDIVHISSQMSTWMCCCCFFIIRNSSKWKIINCFGSHGWIKLCRGRCTYCELVPHSFCMWVLKTNARSFSI